MILKLKLVRETDRARQYENVDGARMWIPRSVCRRTLKWAPAEPGALPVHEVDVDDWFVEKNPWPKTGQKHLF